MKWVSNGDPPLYVREGDTWYNQKDKITYVVYVDQRTWVNLDRPGLIEFPKKTRIFT